MKTINFFLIYIKGLSKIEDDAFAGAYYILSLTVNIQKIAG